MMDYQYKFQNADLTAEERANDLLLHLTLDEKIGMLTNRLDAVPRLGMAESKFGAEIARGLVQRDGFQRETTILPQPWGMAATFNEMLMEKLGEMAGDEVRISNQMDPSSSLVLFGPTVDMERDPRWGRNEEAYGEDPCLTGTLSTAFTKGLAGDNPKYLKCAPLLKHFYANNYEDERQTTNAHITPRMKYEYYLKAFEPSIRKGGAVGLMTAYNCINGVEGVNNPDVWKICKKQWGMAFSLSDGGDFGQNVTAHRTYQDHAQSIADILGIGADMMLDSREMVDPAVREALERGLLPETRLDAAIRDMLKIRFMLGDFDENHPYVNMNPSLLAGNEHKKLAVQASRESMILLENDGLLPLQDNGKCKLAIVGPLSNENYTCWYCGYAENQTSVVEGFKEKIGADRVLFDEGLDRIVIKSKKMGKYLSVKEDGTIAADISDKSGADVFERNDWDFGSWTLRAVKNGKYMTENKSFSDFQNDVSENLMPAALPMRCTAEEAFGWFVMELIKPSEEADGTFTLRSWQNKSIIIDQKGNLVSVHSSGNSGADAFEIEVISSGKDRVAELALQADYVVVCAGNHPLINAREEYDRPDIRLPLAQTVLLESAAKKNENTLLYMVTGYPYSIVEERKMAKAVLLSTHLGPCLGHVAAETIFGENNPAGRTPSTWYRSVKNLPELDDYDIMKNNMTYLYFDKEPLYPFGYGLSYSSFAYSDAHTEKEKYREKDCISVSVTVKNTGVFNGDEVVQIYAVPPKSLYKRPVKMLKAFKRVFVPKGETVKVELTVNCEDLAFWSTEEDTYQVLQGEYLLEIGASSQDIKQTLKIFINGVEEKARNPRKSVEAIDTQDNRNVQFLTDKADGLSYLEAKDFRSFAVYPAFDLSQVDMFECIAATAAGSAKIVLVNHETDAVIGTCSFDGTGGLTRFAAVTCDIKTCVEVVDLRVCFTKNTSLKSFKFY